MAVTSGEESFFDGGMDASRGGKARKDRYPLARNHSEDRVPR
jgi:hypothetical protein